MPDSAAEHATSFAPPGQRSEPYRVLARKYRPTTFRDMIGQDALVRLGGQAQIREHLIDSAGTIRGGGVVREA